MTAHPASQPTAAYVPLSPALEAKEDVLLRALRRFYADPSHLAALADALSGPNSVSLRVLDWLVTNYAKKHNITYQVTGPGGCPSSFNMFVEYKSQLKGFSKRYFDPFCRRERLEFPGTPPPPKDAPPAPAAVCGDVSFSTTIGQLNFFKWALLNRVVQYARAHGDAIEADMMEAIRHRQALCRRDRQHPPPPVDALDGSEHAGHAPARLATRLAPHHSLQLAVSTAAVDPARHRHGGRRAADGDHGPRPKRKELSRAAVKSCTHTKIDFLVRFK